MSLCFFLCNLAEWFLWPDCSEITWYYIFVGLFLFRVLAIIGSFQSGNILEILDCWFPPLFFICTCKLILVISFLLFSITLSFCFAHFGGDFLNFILWLFYSDFLFSYSLICCGVLFVLIIFFKAIILF